MNLPRLYNVIRKQLHLRTDAHDPSFDDITQEAVITIWQKVLHSEPYSVFYAISDAISKVRRRSSPWVEAIYVPLTEIRDIATEIDERGAIALWRLQRLWDGMTASQKAAIDCLVTNEQPTCAALKYDCHKKSIRRATLTALELIDSPLGTPHLRYGRKKAA